MKLIVVSLIFVVSLFADKIIIGKYELVSLERYELQNIRAKIDTGAKTSSLHCNMIRQINENKVEFKLLDEKHEKYNNVIYKADISRIANVKSSNGIMQKRIFIKTNITLGGKSYFTEFSLNDRNKMKFPILLGRSLLEENFLVDVSYEYLLKK